MPWAAARLLKYNNEIKLFRIRIINLLKNGITKMTVLCLLFVTMAQ